MSMTLPGIQCRDLRSVAVGLLQGLNRLPIAGACLRSPRRKPCCRRWMQRVASETPAHGADALVRTAQERWGGGEREGGDGGRHGM